MAKIRAVRQENGKPAVELSKAPKLFVNWDDLNEFIDELQIAGDKAFGPDYSDPRYDV